MLSLPVHITLPGKARTMPRSRATTAPWASGIPVSCGPIAGWASSSGAHRLGKGSVRLPTNGASEGRLITTGKESSWRSSSAHNTLPGRNYYVDFVIEEYLKVMGRYPAFRYVVFFEQGSYVGWMPAERFTALFPHDAGKATKWINDGNFAALRGAGMVGGTILSTATTLEAR